MGIYAELGKLRIGEQYPVRIMGVINVSPESFFKGSIKLSEREILETAELMVKEGAEIIDVGGRSTAPYHSETITVEEEIRRTKNIVKILSETFTTPISIDTTRAEVAEHAVKAGAVIINDVYGFEDSRIVKIIKEYDTAAIVGVKPTKITNTNNPIKETIMALKSSLDEAYENGLDHRKLAIDPCIGFYGVRGEYREEDKERYATELEAALSKGGVTWYVRDFMLLVGMNEFFETLKRPVVIGVSRKSFLRIPTSRRKSEERLYASITAEAYAVLRGASVIRTHNVRETRDAVKVAEWIKLTEKYICPE